MKCQFCNQELPDGAKFCFKCNKQIICKECGKSTLENSFICVFCGAELSTRTQVGGMNHIKYTESESGKAFEASFSDETAGNVVETFVRFLPSFKKNPGVIDVTDEKSVFEDAEDVAVLPPATEQKIHTNQIDQVFKIRGENEIYLHDTSLKASSKVDYAGRLTLLYLFYQQQHGVEEVKRSEVNNFLERTGFNNDGSYRAWLSKNKALYNINNGSYRLCRTGEERAKEYLEDIFNNEKVDNWKLGDKGKTNAKSNNGKRASVGSLSYSVIGSLDLNSTNKDSLKNFIAKYNASSGQEYNVLFVYYLEKIIKEKNIGVNHIYTCYKELKIKYPTNLKQSLFDTKKRKGWIDTANINDIKVLATGENAVEHTLKK